jgi:DNA modification methylase
MERIHNLLLDASVYAANDNVYAWKQNLKEVYKAFKPWLKTHEKKTAANKWRSIDKHKIEFGEFSYSFDTELVTALEDFDFWIQGKLFTHKLSFSRSELNRGLTGQYKKYGLEAKNDN